MPFGVRFSLSNKLYLQWLAAFSRIFVFLATGAAKTRMPFGIRVSFNPYGLLAAATAVVVTATAGVSAPAAAAAEYEY